MRFLNLSLLQKGAAVGVLALALSVVFHGVIFAFVADFFDTSAVPTEQNTLPPLDTGPTAQTKEGAFTLGSALSPAGDVALDMSTNIITDVATPIDAQDMANKAYVDALLGG